MASPTPTASTVAPSPIALPDPLHPSTHRAGEPVDLNGVTVVYRGLVREETGIVALFEVIGGNATTARVGVATEVFGLRPTDGGYAAGPISDDLLTSHGRQLTLLLGDLLIVFEAGPVPATAPAS